MTSQFKPPALPGGRGTFSISSKQGSPVSRAFSQEHFPEGNPPAKPGAFIRNSRTPYHLPSAGQFCWGIRSPDYRFRYH